MAASPFDGLQPTTLWRHFAALTRIPHCSGDERGVAKYIQDWAKEHGFASVQDKAGNVVVRVPATAGKEKAPAVVLQGHLDMVGEKDSTSPHDFAKDPIPARRAGDWITAEGTTLGADNGIGVAAALAAAEDTSLVHGPLELLFTVSEETGLVGANALDPALLQGRTLLNLDTEEEQAIYVGCAGGADTLTYLPVQRATSSGTAVQVRVHGLKGGHSGLDINAGRANALKVMARLLDLLRQRTDFVLVSLAGGDKHNAIPREATAVLVLGERAAAEAVAGVVQNELRAVYGASDPSATVEVTTAASGGPALVRASRDALVDLMLALPHGVLAMSQEVPGLVETSTNLAVVKLSENEALFYESSRSSVMPALAQVQASIAATARLAGARVDARAGYPGWQPNMSSPVLARARQVHEQLLGQAPAIKAIHAGLECGIIGERFGGMDMISIGPHIEAPHSPSERVRIDSVEPFYRFLGALLTSLA